MVRRHLVDLPTHIEGGVEFKEVEGYRLQEQLLKLGLYVGHTLVNVLKVCLQNPCDILRQLRENVLQLASVNKLSNVDGHPLLHDFVYKACAGLADNVFKEVDGLIRVLCQKLYLLRLVYGPKAL